jgi:hypothetical protein
MVFYRRVFKEKVALGIKGETSDFRWPRVNKILRVRILENRKIACYI